jgi:hypothetical protein
MGILQKQSDGMHVVQALLLFGTFVPWGDLSRCHHSLIAIGCRAIGG